MKTGFQNLTSLIYVLSITAEHLYCVWMYVSALHELKPQSHNHHNKYPADIYKTKWFQVISSEFFYE